MGRVGEGEWEMNKIFPSSLLPFVLLPSSFYLLHQILIADFPDNLGSSLSFEPEFE